MAEAVGFKFEDLPVSWNQRDLVLYAVGVGAKADELSLAYELSPDWSPLPTYPLVLGLKGESADVTDFNVMKDHGGKPPGLPKSDAKRLVHAEQSIEILRPIPHVASPKDGFKLVKQLTGVQDKGKGLVLEQTSTLVDGRGIEYARLISSSYNFGDPKLGGFSKVISKPVLPSTPRAPPKDRQPDFELTEATTPEQALMYRLSGDYNPLHIDPSIGKNLGFGGVILHGLCSYGHAARAIIKTAGEGQPARLAAMSARFTSPVKPGDTLHTRIWVSKTNSDGSKELTFTQTVEGSGKLCLGGGVALLKPAAKSSKL